MLRKDISNTDNELDRIIFLLINPQTSQKIKIAAINQTLENNSWTELVKKIFQTLDILQAERDSHLAILYQYVHKLKNLKENSPQYIEDAAIFYKSHHAMNVIDKKIYNYLDLIDHLKKVKTEFLINKLMSLKTLKLHGEQSEIDRHLQLLKTSNPSPADYKKMWDEAERYIREFPEQNQPLPDKQIIDTATPESDTQLFNTVIAYRYYRLDSSTKNKISEYFIPSEQLCFNQSIIYSRLDTTLINNIPSHASALTKVYLPHSLIHEFKKVVTSSGEKSAVDLTSCSVTTTSIFKDLFTKPILNELSLTQPISFWIKCDNKGNNPIQKALVKYIREGTLPKQISLDTLIEKIKNLDSIEQLSILKCIQTSLKISNNELMKLSKEKSPKSNGDLSSYIIGNIAFSFLIGFYSVPGALLYLLLASSVLPTEISKSRYGERVLEVISKLEPTVMQPSSLLLS